MTCSVIATIIRIQKTKIHLRLNMETPTTLAICLLITIHQPSVKKWKTICLTVVCNLKTSQQRLRTTGTFNLIIRKILARLLLLEKDQVCRCWWKTDRRIDSTIRLEPLNSGWPFQIRILRWSPDSSSMLKVMTLIRF